MPAVESLLCPNCGAPLPAFPPTGSTICLYCDAAVRVQGGGPSHAGEPVVEGRLEPKQVAHLKQLILDGSRDKAAALYIQLVGASQAEAARSIEKLEDTLSLDVILHQQLTPVGWLIFTGALVVLVAGLGLAFNGRLNPWIAGFLALLALVNLGVTFRSMLISLEFLGAPITTATVLKIVPVGEVRAGRQLVHIQKVLLEVQPADRPAFQAEMLLPVRDANLKRAAVGAVLKVKYRRDRPQRLVYQD